MADEKSSGGCGKGCLWAFGIFAVLLVLGGMCAEMSDTPSGSSDSSSSARRAAERQARQQEEAEEKRKGFHCLSAWNGSHPGFVREVKRVLNDPGSFDHDETYISPVDSSGMHSIRMRFRARNAFGGMVLSEATGQYRNNNCDSVSVFSVD